MFSKSWRQDMAQKILFDHSSLLEVVKIDNFYYVNYGLHTFQTFHDDDLFLRRFTICQLVLMGIKKSVLAKSFNVHHKSIEKWEKIMKQEGAQGLLNLQVGRDKKYDETIEKYIVDIWKKTRSKFGYKEKIKYEVERLFDVKISREIIRKVINKYNHNSNKEEDKTARLEAEDKIVIKNGGVLLSLPLFEKFNIFKIVETKMRNKLEGYSYKEIIMTLLMLLTGGLIKNEEQIKLNDDPTMGSVIGNKKLPSLRTIRRIVPMILEKIDINELKKKIAGNFLSLYVQKMTFYIDGHFMPYHGKEKILYGYNSTRRYPMKGRTAYVVNSDSGRPIYQRLSDNFDNMKENIIKLNTYLKKMTNEKDVLLVFDRGGYGEEFINKIYNKMKFICWSNEKSSPPRKGRWEKVTRYFESNIYGEKKEEELEVKYEEIEKRVEEDRYILKRFFIKKGNKISVAVTNELDRPIEEIVRILTGRWGAQENVFKELKKNGYDNIHSYWKMEYSLNSLLDEDIKVETMMNNPEYKEAVNERKKLKKKLKKLESKIGTQYLKNKKVNLTTKNNNKIQEEIDVLKDNIDELNERINILPEKILRLDYVTENKIIKLGKEKKDFFDLLKFIAYNVKRDIAEIIGDVYMNNRDIHAMIQKWLKAKCILQKINGEMIINFDCPNEKKEEKALKKFFDHLNKLNYKHFKTGEVMRFQIAPFM